MAPIYEKKYIVAPKTKENKHKKMSKWKYFDKNLKKE